MKNPRILVQHILDAIVHIEQFTKNVTKDEFLSNFMMQHAVIRNIEIIGEASKNIESTVKEKFSYVPWRDINAMRNKLIHEYFAVDTETVWVVLQTDLPELKKYMLDILKSEI